MNRTQADIVAEQAIQEGKGKERVERIYLPGLEQLHVKPREEQAMVFVNLLKSRPNITSMYWELGREYIELSYYLDD
jgi:GrpB-like predicted nucleotidyltransferase (UPF0157 family)